MTRLFATAAVLAIAALQSSQATAGAFGDELSKCFVRSATADDQLTLTRWEIAMLTLAPELRTLSSITAEQRQSFTPAVAAMYQRLIFSDCRKEAVAALKYEGSSATTSALTYLGHTAGHEVMSNPSVTAGLRTLSSYYDKSQWAALYAEAGVPPPPFASH